MAVTRTIVSRGRRNRRDAVTPYLPGERARFWLTVALLLLCFLGGGSSRPSAVALVYLRPALILVGAAIFLLPRSTPSGLRTVWLLLGALAATMLVQMVPLPPALWRALPGRDAYWEAVRLTGQEMLWRPISLSPDRTINSLVSLIPAAVILAGVAGLQPVRRISLVAVAAGLTLASAVLGVVQWTGGGYIHHPTNIGFPVGVFANRNHQAVFLAMAFPLLRLWVEMARSQGGHQRWHVPAAVAAGAFVLMVLLATGSRAGLICAVLAIGAGALLVPTQGRLLPTGRFARWGVIAGILALGALLATILLFDRAVSIDRLTDTESYAAELRFRFTPLLLELARMFAPVGSGFGTFDIVFRAEEPDWALKPTYFNNAHNDLIELAITGGVPALMVLAGFMVWFGRHFWTAWYGRLAGLDEALRRLGGLMVVLMFVASLADYPLRTPFMTAMFALAVAWLVPVRAVRSTH